MYIYIYIYLIYTSRARASRVTEVSKDGRTETDRGEPIGTAADRKYVLCVYVCMYV